MFRETMRAAIEGARTLAQMDELSRQVWQAHASGAVDDAGAQSLAERLHERRGAIRTIVERFDAAVEPERKRQVQRGDETSFRNELRDAAAVVEEPLLERVHRPSVPEGEGHALRDHGGRHERNGAVQPARARERVQRVQRASRGSAPMRSMAASDA